MRELMQRHNLGIEDLSAMPKKASPVALGDTAAAKYRDPDSGKTWTGCGRPSRWLDGRNKEDVLIG